MSTPHTLTYLGEKTSSETKAVYPVTRHGAARPTLPFVHGLLLGIAAGV
jgi:hypothetical protein